jgi:hypothetical protein
MAADMKLAVDKVVVSAPCHVNALDNITSIIQLCMDKVIGTYSYTLLQAN